MDNNEEYSAGDWVIQHIVDKRTSDQFGVEYMVKWTNALSEPSWHQEEEMQEFTTFQHHLSIFEQKRKKVSTKSI